MGAIYDATWGRGFAAIYDRFLKGSEEAGLSDMRRELLAEASGDVIDIGAGTGVNLDLFPQSVTRLVMAEPFEHMARRLRERIEESGRFAEVVEAPAEALPFPDASFDFAVFTLVLCTVDDPDASLAEAARVLRPGGRMLFLEHVVSDDTKLARWQDRFERPWHFFAAGCHPNRDTGAAIRRSPLEIESLIEGEFPKAPPIAKPLIHGSARLPT
jgi:ubiquinone/menaquinone biosynthesis C-methylase UbiE